MVVNSNSIMLLVACLCCHLASSTRRNKLDNRKLATIDFKHIILSHMYVSIETSWLRLKAIQKQEGEQGIPE